jgi:hypothetical protein
MTGRRSPEKILKAAGSVRNICRTPRCFFASPGCGESGARGRILRKNKKSRDYYNLLIDNILRQHEIEIPEAAGYN